MSRHVEALREAPLLRIRNYRILSNIKVFAGLIGQERHINDLVGGPHFTGCAIDDGKNIVTRPRNRAKIRLPRAHDRDTMAGADRVRTDLVGRTRLTIGALRITDSEIHIAAFAVENHAEYALLALIGNRSDRAAEVRNSCGNIIFDTRCNIDHLALAINVNRSRRLNTGITETREIGIQWLRTKGIPATIEDKKCDANNTDVFCELFDNGFIPLLFLDI